MPSPPTAGSAEPPLPDKSRFRFQKLLQPFALNQPVSQTADAVRGLMLGTPHGQSTWIALAWAIGAVLVLAPLAVNKYRKVA